MIGKRTLLLLVFLAATLAGWAQQVPLYSMLEVVRPALNPAYTGNDEISDMVLLSRQQWVGFDGAPVSYYLAGHAPLRNHQSGVGFDYQRMNSGPLTQNGLFLSYSYTVNLSDKSSLAFGLRGGFNSYRLLYSQLDVIQPGDPLFETDLNHRILPNFGTGIHFTRGAYFIDLSLPQLLRNEFRADKEQKAGKDNREDRTFYFLSGCVLYLSEGISLHPSLGLWWMKGSPALVDLRVLARVKESMGVGLAYRISGSFSAYFNYRIVDSFTLGYAYELPLSYDYRLSSGTHEVVLGFDFEFLNRKTQSPRMF